MSDYGGEGKVLQRLQNPLDFDQTDQIPMESDGVRSESDGVRSVRLDYGGEGKVLQPFPHQIYALNGMDGAG